MSLGQIFGEVSLSRCLAAGQVRMLQKMLQQLLKKLYQLLTSRSDWQGGQQGQLGCRRERPGRVETSFGHHMLGRLGVPAGIMMQFR